MKVRSSSLGNLLGLRSSETVVLFQHYSPKMFVFVADQACVMISHFPVTCVPRRVKAPSDAAALQSLECSSEDLKERPWIITLLFTWNSSLPWCCISLLRHLI